MFTKKNVVATSLAILVRILFDAQCVMGSTGGWTEIRFNENGEIRRIPNILQVPTGIVTIDGKVKMQEYKIVHHDDSPQFSTYYMKPSYVVWECTNAADSPYYICFVPSALGHKRWRLITDAQPDSRGKKSTQVVAALLTKPVNGECTIMHSSDLVASLMNEDKRRRHTSALLAKINSPRSGNLLLDRDDKYRRVDFDNGKLLEVSEGPSEDGRVNWVPDPNPSYHLPRVERSLTELYREWNAYMYMYDKNTRKGEKPSFLRDVHGQRRYQRYRRFANGKLFVLNEAGTYDPTQSWIDEGTDLGAQSRRKRSPVEIVAEINRELTLTYEPDDRKGMQLTVYTGLLKYVGGRVATLDKYNELFVLDEAKNLWFPKSGGNPRSFDLGTGWRWDEPTRKWVRTRRRRLLSPMANLLAEINHAREREGLEPLPATK